jgi:two-component system OmpR family response regulator
MPKLIAIVEDDEAIRNNYAAALSRQGYRVLGYADRQSALAAFDLHLPDLVIIDINLGDEVEGGFDLCRELRARSLELPIIFLTARDSELDAISGLRLGADDYLTKTISVAHLAARVTALLRRVEALVNVSMTEERLQRGGLTLFIDRLAVTWRDQPVNLTLTEFWLIHAMAKFPGHVKSRQQLMDAASVVLDDNTITSHIKRLRRKFLAIDPGFNAIETVYGMGYRWNLAPGAG